jgi:signal transduction histidine kinase
MKLLPRTLYGQMLLALFVGLLAAQSVGFWLMLDERVRFGEKLLGAYAAQRLAGVISILDHASPSERTRLLRALNVPPIHVSLNEPWSHSGEVNNDEAQTFVERLTKELDRPMPLQLLSIKGHEGRHRNESAEMREGHPPPPGQDDNHFNPHMRRGGPPVLFVVGQARLSDGAVLTFRQSLPQQRLDWPLRLLILLIVLGVSVALLAGWAVRRLTRPLASLADAASGLARNLERPPLPEQGPLEVSRAAQAFNAMQRDLKRYLETRAQALAGVSHDLRMPITRLRLRLERIPDDELKAKMESDLSEMDEMIGNTLEYLRAGSTSEQMKKLDLNALLESVIEDMMAVGAQVQLHGKISGPVLARPQALRRCIVNLLDNARRYGSAVIDVFVTEQNESLSIRIEDSGPGMPVAELERVFEPYVRLESSRAKHTGAIARNHGGEIKLENRSCGGTAAIVTLPRSI